MFRRTQDPGRAALDFAYGAITLSRVAFQPASAIHHGPMFQSYNPNKQACWFGLFPFRSPLLGESNFLSLPAGNEMFQFPASSSTWLCIHHVVIPDQGYWVAPFGNLRINACLQLPGAYRCLSRPSSAPSAKASTVRPCSLNQWSSFGSIGPIKRGKMFWSFLLFHVMVFSFQGTGSEGLTPQN